MNQIFKCKNNKNLGYGLSFAEKNDFFIYF